MQFKDAAYEILKEAGGPLHYNEITDRAQKKNILTTSGQTPQSTMGALLYTDTLKPNSRFRRGDKKGTFALRITAPSDIQQQINAIDASVRKTLVNRLLKMDPRKFEKLVQSLLDEMGLNQTSVTAYSGDGGIDVRGVLNAENLSQIIVAVQAKRWKANVGPKVVRELRGSLKVHEHGIVITPSGYTASALIEAEEAGKTPISLIDGAQLVDLLIQHQVGVKQEAYTVPVLDDEYWSVILGEDLSQPDTPPPAKKQKEKTKPSVKLPLPIQVEHNGQMYAAELLDLAGKVRYAGVLYETPSAAAKVVATDWKAVNGWAFWKYLDNQTGEWVKVGLLRK